MKDLIAKWNVLPKRFKILSVFGVVVVLIIIVETIR